MSEVAAASAALATSLNHDRMDKTKRNENETYQPTTLMERKMDTSAAAAAVPPLIISKNSNHTRSNNGNFEFDIDDISSSNSSFINGGVNNPNLPSSSLQYHHHTPNFINTPTNTHDLTTINQNSNPKNSSSETTLLSQSHAYSALSSTTITSSTNNTQNTNLHNNNHSYNWHHSNSVGSVNSKNVGGGRISANSAHSAEPIKVIVSKKPASPTTSGEASKKPLSIANAFSTAEASKKALKRNRDLLSRFPDISKSGSNEVVLEDFACAIARGHNSTGSGIVNGGKASSQGKLVQGKIYLTKRRLCFYSPSMLGKKAIRLTLLFEDITSIKRKMSVGIIPNAIEIISDSTPVYFTSFVSRDEAFDSMVAIWKQSNVESFFSASHLGEMVMNTAPVVVKESGGSIFSRPSSPLERIATPELPIEETQKSTCSHFDPLFTEICDETFPCSLSDMWDLLMGDGTSHIATVDDASKKPAFLDWFLTKKRLVLNLEKTSWLVSSSNAGNDAASNNGASLTKELDILPLNLAKAGDSRTLFFDMNLGLQTASNKQNVFVKDITPNSACVESKTTNSGVPFASSYCTLVKTCIRDEGNGLTRLTISYHVQFEKDCYTIIKNPVMNAIKNRLPEFYADLISQLRSHFSPLSYHSGKSGIALRDDYPSVSTTPVSKVPEDFTLAQTPTKSIPLQDAVPKTNFEAVPLFLTFSLSLAVILIYLFLQVQHLSFEINNLKKLIEAKP